MMCQFTLPSFADYSLLLPTKGWLKLTRSWCLVLCQGGLPVQRRSPTRALTRLAQSNYVDRDQTKPADTCHVTFSQLHLYTHYLLLRKLYKLSLSPAQRTTVDGLTVWISGNALVVINIVVLHGAQVLSGRVTDLQRENQLGAKPATQVYSAGPSFHGQVQ